MGDQKHIIGRQRFELTIEERDQGAYWQDQVAQIFKRDMLPTMDRLFSELSGKDEILRIDQLELDIGTISTVDFHGELKRKVLQQLEDQLRARIYRARSNEPTSLNGGEERAQLIRADDDLLNRFVTFLRTGTCSWQAPGKRSTPAQTLEELLRLGPSSARPVLIDLTSLPEVLKRIYYQLDLSQRDRLLAFIFNTDESTEQHISRSFEALIESVQEQPSVRKKELIVKRERWALLELQVRCMEQHRGVSPERSMSAGVFKMFFRRLFEVYPEQRESLFQTLVAALEAMVLTPRHRRMSELMSGALQEIAMEKKIQRRKAHPSFPSRDRGSSEETKGSAEQTRPTMDPVAERKHRQDRVEDVAHETKEGKAGRDVSSPEDSNLDTADKTEASAKSQHSETPDVGQSPDPSRSSDQFVSESSSGEREGSWDTPVRRRALPDLDMLPVENAGLVILHPFLKYFFEGLGLVENNEFNSIEAQFKAIHLLQYPITQGAEVPEQDLLLNKLLCGLPIDEPIPLSVDFSATEREECDNLLQAVLGQWSALRTDNPQGLIETFLKREGSLTYKNGWTLKVARDTFDVLLDKLPWGLSMIKLPWNTEMIYVEW